MICFEEALDRILSEIRPLDAEPVGIVRALGRAAAGDIRAEHDLPPFDNSAMDGYALRSADIEGASPESPAVLRVIEDVRAGYVASRTVEPGTAIRIMTGAPIPAGADAVVRVEATGRRPAEGGGEGVGISRKVAAGANIRRRAENVARGDPVIRAGDVIRPQEIGILASLGIPEIAVVRRPRVAVVATGDELLDITEELRPGRIRNSNGYSLRAQVLKYGGEAHSLGIARDDRAETEKKLAEGLGYDMLIVSGGVSVGDYDFVRDAIESLGVEIKLWKVAIRPGKPVAFGMKVNKPVFGLPGNPVSSMITFEQFVRPAILKMAGRRDLAPRELNAILRGDIEKRKGFRYFVRGRLEQVEGKLVVTPARRQGAGILSSLVTANALIVLPEDVTKAPRGETVRVQPLD